MSYCLCDPNIQAHVDGGTHAAVTCCPVTKSLIHVPRLSRVLGLFWPTAGCLMESWRGGGVDMEVWDGWVGLGAFTNRGRMWEFQIEISHSCFAVPACRRGQQPALLSQPMLRAQEESGSVFYHQGILKSSWEKITAERGERRPERYISPAFTSSDKSLTALSFLPLAYFLWLSFNGFCG